MGTINCLGISIKIKKILACLFWAIFGVCLLTIPTFAAENIGGEPVDRSGTVTYISIPNEDGTFTTLEGKEAQEWYDRAVREGKQRESMLESEYSGEGVKSEAETRGPFHYKYRYRESSNRKNVERTELEKTVTNKIRNDSSSQQSYQLSLSVSQSWSVSPSVEGKYKDAIKAKLGGSWGKSYSKTDSFTINVKPRKTVWVTFIPIMDESKGKVQKYYIPRGGLSKDEIVVKSTNVVTYNPKYLTVPIGKFIKTKSVYGVYVWHES